MQHLLDDFRKINRKLEETSEKEQKSHLYMDMIVLIEEIADYIIPEDNEIRKGRSEERRVGKECCLWLPLELPLDLLQAPTTLKSVISKSYHP